MQVQTDIEKYGFSDSFHLKELEAHCKLDFLLGSKRKLVSDECRVKWLENGDQNSRFFQDLISRRRAQ